MPVFPLVGSRMMVSGLINPACSAASIMATPMRSLTLPPGLKNSSLATTSATAPSVTRRSRSSGVFPTSCVMSSAMLIYIRSNDRGSNFVGLPLYVELYGHHRGDGQRNRGKPLCRSVQRHAGQHASLQIVESCRVHCRRRRTRCAAQIEIGPRFDCIDGKPVGVDQIVSVGGGEREWGCHLKRPDELAVGDGHDIDQRRLGGVVVGPANCLARPAEQVVVQMHNLVGVPVMACARQPEADPLDFRRTGL